MKSKLTLFVIFVSALFVLVFYLRFHSLDPYDLPIKAAMNPVKCTSTNFYLDEPDSTKQIAPLFEDLGSHEFTIQTKVEMAQVFFNQGLNLAFAFNHAESHRSFLEASRLDPNAAMTYWGQAYALGPNINDHIPDSERRIKSYEAVQKALENLDNTTPKEKSLITALSKRYSPDTLAEIKDLNLAYMEAMSEVAKDYPEDPDILTLYAAAVMNTVPWDYWDANGKPSPNIPEAKQALEKAIKLDPGHPGAHHYYIHMVELPKPDLAVPSAEKLATLMPGAGHLVHMPGHIYMRVGRYKDAVLANQAAILVDEEYISQCYAQGMYPLGYYPHNIHFLWSAASMMGNEELALDAAKKIGEKVSVSLLGEEQIFQNFAATPLLAYMRFGKWNDILTTPDPGENLSYLRMIRTYTRGIAFTRKGNLKEAREELEELEKRDKELKHENIAKVAFEVLSGEILAASGDLKGGIEHLKTAVLYEDELPYDEPDLWYIPTRQHLGRLLLLDEQFSEAQAAYLEDLEYYRQNGWSLIGLYHSLKNQGKSAEANRVLKEFKVAWKDADIEISSSVL